MPGLVILGASGFLGRALIECRPAALPVKAVARRAPQMLPQTGVSWHEVDLLQPYPLDAVLQPGDVVCNLAYMRDVPEQVNIELIDNIIESCVRCGAARLVHTSTALVAGATGESRVTDATPCAPFTAYEKTKWLVEQRVVGALARGLDVAVLRPTAIVGEGGENLVTLARALLDGNRVVNYLRASLFGRRAMNLVPVRNVAAAIVHVAALREALAGNIYYVSADDEPGNDFRSVERLLAEALQVPARRVPVVPLPPQLLSVLLTMRGRSATDLGRTYDSQKLLSTGFRPVASVQDAVREFGVTLRQRRQADGNFLK